LMSPPGWNVTGPRLETRTSGVSFDISALSRYPSTVLAPVSFADGHRKTTDSVELLRSADPLRTPEQPLRTQGETR
jgi:hypothetical protein